MELGKIFGQKVGICIRICFYLRRKKRIREHCNFSVTYIIKFWPIPEHMATYPKIVLKFRVSVALEP